MEERMTCTTGDFEHFLCYFESSKKKGKEHTFGFSCMYLKRRAIKSREYNFYLA